MNIQKIKHLKRCDIPRGELITVIGIFVIVFLVMIPYRDYFYFLDEKDNLLGGQTIADGGQIYTSFICGHTPGMYYISALLMKVGISSQESIRMVMYVMLLFLWIGLYFRYRKEFPPLLIPLYTIMFIALFGRTGYEHMFLAEQIQAQVYVICLCEYFLFRKRKKLTWDSSIISACAIFFAVLCAAVSVWPIVLLIIAILYQYALGIKKGELGYGQLKEVLLPFVLLCVFFAAWGIYLFVTDTWEECLWWAYRFNREIYSEYTNYGKSIITTLLNSFLTYGTMCRDVIQNLTANFYYNIRILCEVAINFIFVFYFGQKNIVEGVLLFCFCIWTNSRGFSANPSFHALPYWSVTAFMAAFLMLSHYKEFVEKIKLDVQ